MQLKICRFAPVPLVIDAGEHANGQEAALHAPSIGFRLLRLQAGQKHADCENGPSCQPFRLLNAEL